MVDSHLSGNSKLTVSPHTFVQLGHHSSSFPYSTRYFHIKTRRTGDSRSQIFERLYKLEGSVVNGDRWCCVHTLHEYAGLLYADGKAKLFTADKLIVLNLK